MSDIKWAPLTDEQLETIKPYMIPNTSQLAPLLTMTETEYKTAADFWVRQELEAQRAKMARTEEFLMAACESITGNAAASLRVIRREAELTAELAEVERLKSEHVCAACGSSCSQ